MLIGYFYAVTRQTGGICTRGAKPIYAKAAEWAKLLSTMEIVQLIPVTTEMLAYAVPLFDDVCECGAEQRRAWHGHAEGCSVHAVDVAWLAARQAERAS